MFDIGMAEVLVIATVAIVVVGPKDLPKLLRNVGKTISGVKRMAGDFQRQFNDAIEETGLDDVKNIATGKGLNPLDGIKNAAKDMEADLTDGLNGDDKSDEPLFPENETSKKLAEMNAKETAASSKSTVKSSKTKKPAAKASTKKTSAKKPAAKAAPKKAAVKKSTKAKAPSKSKAK